MQLHPLRFPAGAGLEEQGVAGKAGADRAIRYLNRAGLDEGSGTSQACVGMLT